MGRKYIPSCCCGANATTPGCCPNGLASAYSIVIPAFRVARLENGNNPFLTPLEALFAQEQAVVLNRTGGCAAADVPSGGFYVSTKIFNQQSLTDIFNNDYFGHLTFAYVTLRIGSLDNSQGGIPFSCGCGAVVTVEWGVDDYNGFPDPYYPHLEEERLAASEDFCLNHFRKPGDPMPIVYTFIAYRCFESSTIPGQFDNQNNNCRRMMLYGVEQPVENGTTPPTMPDVELIGV